MSDDTQKAALAFLANPATRGGSAVKRVDTHAARCWPAIPPQIKRAVKFPFLISRRLTSASALEAEIEANRPFAHDLYCEVTPIVCRNGSLAHRWGRRGREWALKMHRRWEATLDRLAERGRIDTALIEALARAVAAAHARAPVVRRHPGSRHSATISTERQGVTNKPICSEVLPSRIAPAAHTGC